MYHLCYAYIPKYKGIKDVEITVDPHYKCYYDRETNWLQIDDTDRIPSDFWGPGIYSLSAIVGNNGVGKSTAVEYLLQAIVSGANQKHINGILVYEQDNEFYVYSRPEVQVSAGIKRLDTPARICCLYYSGQFMPELSLHNLRCGELEGAYNISDGHLLKKDVQNYSGTDYLHNQSSFGASLAQYNAQNHIRICRMLANESLYDKIKAFCAPRYIIVSENKSGVYAADDYYRLKTLDSESKKEIPKANLKNTENEERVLTKCIYNNFLSILFNSSRYEIDNNILKYLGEWQEYFSDSKPVLPQFKVFIDSYVKDKSLSQRLVLVHDALSELDSIASFKKLWYEGFYYLEIAKNHEGISKLLHVLENSPYLVASFFDIAYAQDLEIGTILSAGEQKLLDLFSRLYGAIQKDREKFSNLKAPALIILDEAEQAFHPEWQRKYVHLLLSFLQQMLVMPGFGFQLLLTTHSPVLLSDIPSDCITFLRKEKGRTKNVSPKPGTFAANIFDLYRNSFFLENGMVGEFAAKKLKEIEAKVAQCEFFDRKMYVDLLKEIDLIGDPKIRDYLLKRLPVDKVEDEKSFLIERLKYLENIK